MSEKGESNSRPQSRQNKKDYNNFNCFRKSIPIMPRMLAIICCIFNIIFPGLGKFYIKIIKKIIFFLIFKLFLQ